MGYKHKKEDIIAAGSELIRKKGYHNVGINEILKVCVIPKGSFYNFFNSKEDFMEQSLEEYGKKSLQLMHSFLHNVQLSPLQRLKDLYAHLLDINEKDGCDAGCLINNLAVELGGTNPSIAHNVNQQIDNNVAALAFCIQEGQEKGEIITAFSANYLAEYIQTGLYGAFTRMKAQKNRAYLDKWYAITFEFLKA